MIKGELRSEIMDKCPVGFEDDLKDFIDKVEELSAEIVNKLTINDISDIGNVEDAYGLADNLSDGLYQ